jgi:hypothetical protein
VYHVLETCAVVLDVLHMHAFIRHTITNFILKNVNCTSVKKLFFFCKITLCVRAILPLLAVIRGTIGYIHPRLQKASGLYRFDIDPMSTTSDRYRADVGKIIFAIWDVDRTLKLSYEAVDDRTLIGTRS